MLKFGAFLVIFRLVFGFGGTIELQKFIQASTRVTKTGTRFHKHNVAKTVDVVELTSKHEKVQIFPM